MIIKISKNFLDAFPVTSTRILTTKSKFCGWNNIESVEIVNSRVLSAFDLQTLLSIFYLFSQNKIYNREWQTQENHFISVKTTSCKWSEFIINYRKRKSYQGPKVYESLKNIANLMYTLEFKDGHKEIQRLLWHFTLYYYDNKDNFKEVKILRGQGRSSKQLLLGLTIDANFWNECQKGLFVNIEPLLNLTNPTAILLGLWIQVQKYSSIKEEDLCSYILRDNRNKAIKKRLLINQAFNLLKDTGLISKWSHNKKFKQYVYTWKRNF